MQHFPNCYIQHPCNMSNIRLLIRPANTRHPSPPRRVVKRIYKTRCWTDTGHSNNHSLPVAISTFTIRRMVGKVGHACPIAYYTMSLYYIFTNSYSTEVSLYIYKVT